MTIQTSTTDRGEMVRAISERLQIPAVYQRMPTCAYQVGAITVNRDGSIASDDEALLERVRPLLAERGWLAAGPVTEPAPEVEGTAPEEDSEALRERIQPMLARHGWLGGYTDEEMDEALAAIPSEYLEPEAAPAPEAGVEPAMEQTMETAPEAQKEENSEASEDNAVPAGQSVDSVDIVTPLEGWTVTQMANLLRTLYSKQYLLNRMMQGETLFIDASVLTAIEKDPPASAAGFEALAQREAGAGRMRGVAFEGGKLIFSTPYHPETPTLWMTYDKLLAGILKNAKGASRVFINPQANPANEKYYANSWLMRMGFGGPEYRELRRVLMRHLGGYAAFKSESDMQAHREKCAARRREQRAQAQTNNDNKDMGESE